MMKKMPVEKKSSVKNSALRVFLTGIAILVQLFWIMNFLGAFRILSQDVSRIVSVLAVFVALWIYGRDKNMSINVPWMVLILIFPIVGLILYFMMGRTSLTNPIRKVYRKIDNMLDPYFRQDPLILQDLKHEDLAIYNQAYLIRHSGNFPIYEHTDITYYSTAYEGFLAQLEALKKAKHFIFMEYHAIEDGGSFQQMKDILVLKAKEGVEVRIAYDDIGSAFFLNKQFKKQMEANGIQCRIFNPIRPWIQMFMNNRDHRKIMVIDGEIAFTGGYNLADEYFNITHPYGYWKDTGIQMRGLAVNSMTLIFLEMWNVLEHSDHDITQYLRAKPVVARGYVQPYADSPLDEEYLGENAYMNILNNAKKYVYFVTPYLIITDEMVRAMTLACKRGVDVRIITPGIPDKKITYRITRSNYRVLVNRGVRIYEYTPGFSHAKMCVSDAETAIIGTINLDYRSLYLNFENGVFLYDVKAIHDIYEDFMKMFEQSQEVTKEYEGDAPMLLRTWNALLRLMAPLF